MIIRIEDPETCRLAVELAQLTGETITGAVTIALRERLERVREHQRAEARFQDLKAISQECAAGLGPGPSAVEHGDFLYDEHGAPK